MGPHDKAKYLKFFGFFKTILLKYESNFCYYMIFFYWIFFLKNQEQN